MAPLPIHENYRTAKLKDELLETLRWPASHRFLSVQSSDSDVKLVSGTFKAPRYISPWRPVHLGTLFVFFIVWGVSRRGFWLTNKNKRPVVCDKMSELIRALNTIII